MEWEEHLHKQNSLKTNSKCIINGDKSSKHSSHRFVSLQMTSKFFCKYGTCSLFMHFVLVWNPEAPFDLRGDKFEFQQHTKNGFELSKSCIDSNLAAEDEAEHKTQWIIINSPGMNWWCDFVVFYRCYNYNANLSFQIIFVKNSKIYHFIHNHNRSNKIAINLYF